MPRTRKIQIVVGSIWSLSTGFNEISPIGIKSTKEYYNYVLWRAYMALGWDVRNIVTQPQRLKYHSALVNPI